MYVIADVMLQYFSRDSVTLLIEREDIHSLGQSFQSSQLL